MQEEANGSSSRALFASSAGGAMVTFSSAETNFFPSQLHSVTALALEMTVREKGFWDSHDDNNNNHRVENFCDDDDALTNSGMTTSAVASPSDHHRCIHRSDTRSRYHYHRQPQQQQYLRRYNENWDGDGKMCRRNAVSESIPSNLKHDELEAVFDENDNISDPLLIAARNATAIANEEGFEGSGTRRRRQRCLEEEDQLQNEILQPNATATVLLVNDCSCSSVTEDDDEDDEEEPLVESYINSAMPPSMPSRRPLNDFLGGLHRERQSRQQQQLRPPPYVHHSWSQQLQTRVSTASNTDRSGYAMEDFKTKENVDRSQDNATETDSMYNINRKSCRHRGGTQNGRDSGSHDGLGNERVGFDYGDTAVLTNGLAIGDEERSRNNASSSLSHSSGVVTDPTTVVPKWKRSVLLPSHSSLY